MKILLYTEMYAPCGIDTFIVNLINHWPHKNDLFVILANRDYPGLSVIESNLTRPAEVLRHDLLLYPNVLHRTLLHKVVKHWITPVLKYLFLANNVLALRHLLRRISADVLMVINGGYPGGDSCRAASISWGLFVGKPHSIHNFHSIVRKAPWYLALQERLVDGLVCRYTRKFVTVSRASADSLEHRPYVFEMSRVSHIHNGLEMDVSQQVAGESIRAEIGVSADTPLCLMLAVYEPTKGHLFLFEAFGKVLQQVPDAHLLVCGYALPFQEKAVATYVSDLQLDANVHLMGFRSDVSHLIESADVVVVPSQEYESFGLVSVEAMIHKTAVVATNVGGIPEVVVSGEGGFCVDKDDVDQFAKYLVQLLADDNFRKEQGERGYQRYQKYFTASRMASNYAELIHHPGKAG